MFQLCLLISQLPEVNIDKSLPKLIKRLLLSTCSHLLTCLISESNLLFLKPNGSIAMD